MASIAEPEAANPDRQKPVISAVWARLLEELGKHNLASDFPQQPPDFASFEMRQDPFDGSEAFFGFWQLSGSARRGEFILYGDGKAFVEVDVLLKHPSKPNYFIEAVTVWGKADALKAEFKLMPMPE